MKTKEVEKKKKQESPQNRVVEGMGSCAPETAREGEGVDPRP